MQVRYFLALGAAAIVGATTAKPGAAAPPEPPPRLAVLVVVDQLGSNLLQHHRRSLTGGLARLLNGGRYFPNGVVDHAPTNSLPGHLSVSTGAHPRRHGIIDNGWVEKVDGRAVLVSGFSDPACRKLGPDGAVGAADEPGIGPGRFESATIVEWVLEADPKARFASLGTGGGVSALHAGKVRGPVLWFDASSAGYVSSTCYLAQMPGWAVTFNQSLAQQYMAEDWRLAAPATMTAELRPDDSVFEHDGQDIRFPHVRPDGEQLPQWFNFSPFVDSATLGLAREAVVAGRLGADDVTDVLTLGLSSLDHIGHRYGPFSVEQADALHRLDRNLADFFEFLDAQVGSGNWTLALTADHGAPPAPEDATRFGIEGARRISEEEIFAAIDSIRAAAGPEGETVAAARAALALPFIGRVIIADQLSTPVDELERRYANSYRPGRVSRHPFYENADGEGVAEYGIIPVPHQHWVIDWATSTHGSPFGYDGEVPLMFYGRGVAAGEDEARVRTIDVAPTLATLAGIAPPAEVDGRQIDLSSNLGD